MQEFLIQIDLWLFNWINQVFTFDFLDQFFPIWTDFHKTFFFKVLCVPLIFFFAYRAHRFFGVIFVFFTALILGLGDGFWGKIIKPWIARPRPPLSDLIVTVRAPHFGGYSFPSNHAANMFFLAMFAGYFFPRLRWPLFIIAFVTAYSRVYCGVHYPSDVIGGAIFGFCWAVIFIFLLRNFINKVKERFDVRMNSTELRKMSKSEAKNV